MDLTSNIIPNSSLLKILINNEEFQNIVNETTQDLLLVAKTELTLIDFVKYFFIVIVILLILNSCFGGLTTHAIERSRKKTREYFQNLQQNGL